MRLFWAEIEQAAWLAWRQPEGWRLKMRNHKTALEQALKTSEIVLSPEPVRATVQALVKDEAVEEQAAKALLEFCVTMRTSLATPPPTADLST